MSHEKLNSVLSDSTNRSECDNSAVSPTTSVLYYSQEKPNYPQNNTDNDVDDLGPLPPKWEKAVTENGEVYFIDHSSGTSHWLDPRLSKFQKKTLEDCLDDELPYGWEKITDPQYGTYFIDHVNRRTQYENPVLAAKRAAEASSSSLRELSDGSGRSGEQGTDAPGGGGSAGERGSFTRDPSELCGQRFRTSLLKSSRGLGFTIVGGDDEVDEFLQIKSIVPNGPAWLDGKLQTGDIIVYVNETCVLGYTHNKIVRLFQSIAAGETVMLEVCRGYSLPFDPNDPNTEVVTTIAVDSNLVTEPDSKLSFGMDGNYNFLKPLEQLDQKDINNCLDSNNFGLKNAMKELNISPANNVTPNQINKVIVNISIVKGSLGFGFTIADSACGQRVKKILDRQRCKNLLEGDILIEINSINVQEMSHDEVVQVLKNCPHNEDAVICVQRGQPAKTTNKNKIKKIDNCRLNSKDLFNSYRSKTPTADIYSTQPKEVLPSRPKTPLVDTRIINGRALGDMSVSTKSLRRDITEMLGYESMGLSDHSNQLCNATYPGAYDNGPLSCSQTDINVNLNELSGAYKHGHGTGAGHPPPMYGGVGGGPASGYDSGPVYGEHMYGPGHLDTCYCYECKQMKLASSAPTRLSHPLSLASPHHPRPGSDLTIMNIDINSYEENEYTHSSHKANSESDYGQNSVGMNKSWSVAPPPLPLPLSLPHPMSEQIVDVTLARHESGFGFRIVGGGEEGSQVAVGHIVPGGAADLDGRLSTGDEILSVDGHSVLKASHHQVVQLMGNAALRGRVSLRLRRRLHSVHQVPTYPHPSHSHGGQLYDVTVTRTENEGFGFVIISSANKVGSTIGRLIEGSPAERCGQLQVGNHIVAVNNIDITHLCHGDIVNLIKDSGFSVTLTIDPQQDLR